MLDMMITFPGNKRVDAALGQFTIQTDQPKDEGGDETAPEPFALFLASIGTCAGIYVLGFCRSRGIPTDDIRIVQTNDWDKQERRVVRIILEVRLPAGFPPKYRRALIRAIEQCTVKRNISSPPEFAVETVIAG